MLDLDHPLTPYIFRAAALEDTIRAHLVALRSASVDDAAVRFRQIVDALIPSLHALNDAHFGASAGIRATLDALSLAATQQDVERCWDRFMALAESPGDNFGTWAI